MAFIINKSEIRSYMQIDVRRNTSLDNPFRNHLHAIAIAFVIFIDGEVEVVCSVDLNIQEPRTTTHRQRFE